MTTTSIDPATSTRRRSRIRRLLAGGGALAIALLLSACHYVGSGTVTSATGNGPATFNFNFNCPTGSHYLSGALVYTDPAAHVSLQAVLNHQYQSSTCAPTNYFGYGGSFYGTYASRTTSGSGNFELDVYGATSASDPGHFELTLTSGPYSGYHNSGPVTAGGIVGIPD